METTRDLDEMNQINNYINGQVRSKEEKIPIYNKDQIMSYKLQNNKSYYSIYLNILNINKIN